MVMQQYYCCITNNNNKEDDDHNQPSFRPTFSMHTVLLFVRLISRTALVLYYYIVTLSLGLLLVVDDGLLHHNHNVSIPLSTSNSMHTVFRGTDRSHCVALILGTWNAYCVLLLARRQPSCNCLPLDR